MLGNGYSTDDVLASGRKWGTTQIPPYSEAELIDKISYFARKQQVQVEDITSELMTDCKTVASTISGQSDNLPSDVRSSQFAVRKFAVRKFAGC